VQTVMVRNKSTAWWNSRAPRATVCMTPPRVWTTSTNASRHCRRSRLGSGSTGVVAVGTPVSFVASVTNNQKRTSNACCCADGSAASMARCRYSAYRSRYRCPIPFAHLRTAARDTSCVRATSVTDAPTKSSAAAAKMFWALLVFPGKTSHGTMRSRALQLMHRDSRIAIML
jgi:hypothetical protein